MRQPNTGKMCIPAYRSRAVSKAAQRCVSRRRVRINADILRRTRFVSCHATHERKEEQHPETTYRDATEESSE